MSITVKLNAVIASPEGMIVIARRRRRRGDLTEIIFLGDCFGAVKRRLAMTPNIP